MVWDTGHAAVHKNRNFTHLDDQFDQYMFVLRISIFEIDGTDLVYIEYYSGYKSTLNWWRKMVWNFCNHSSTDVQSTASTEILQTFLMTNLINICSF